MQFPCILSCAKCLRRTFTTFVTVFSAMTINQGLRIEPHVQVENAVTDSSLQGFEFSRNHLNKTGSALAVSRTKSLHVKSCFQFCFCLFTGQVAREFSKASERLLNKTKRVCGRVFKCRTVWWILLFRWLRDVSCLKFYSSFCFKKKNYSTWQVGRRPLKSSITSTSPMSTIILNF